MNEPSYSVPVAGLPPVQIGNMPVTMSSREIAELCEKRHADVMRDCRTTFAELELDERSFASTYLDSQNREKPEFKMPRDITFTVVTGYSIRLRKKVIDRLDELEARLRQGTLIDFSNPAVLLGVVTHLQTQVGQQSLVIAAQGKRLTTLDRMEGAVENITITEAAKVLKVKPRFLTKFLHENRWIYKRPNSGHWLAYQALMPKYLDHRPHTYKDDEGETHFVTYAVVTPAGMVKLAAMLEAHFGGKEGSDD